MSEAPIQKAILAYLKGRGVLAWRNGLGGLKTGSGGRRKNPAKGTPDIFGVLPGGRFLAIEVKGPDGVASVDQLRWLDDFAKLGAVALIARSVEDVEHALYLASK